MDSEHETRWLDAQEQQIWAQLSTMILRLGSPRAWKT